ncbi:MAG TPA: class I SAM-dependent methyltransferase, partial [Bdellovibrionota bacterium]|nr:class I SAM-dependent methyltransferase [Bdellovibrionota bacterium]
MDASSLMTFPLGLYSRARYAGFGMQNMLFHALGSVDPAVRDYVKQLKPEIRKDIHDEILALLDRDVRQIAEGMYPPTVLLPESPVQHFSRLPRLVLAATLAQIRRRQGRTAVFNRSASRFLEKLPRYYRRNFHFQPNGYLSSESAELYEHQVEILFQGASDAMRRLIIPPLKKHFSGNPDGEGLHFLEVAAGTGRATRFVKLAFPKAR